MARARGPNLARVVASAGGVAGSNYLRSGMRDMTFARSHYAGKNRAQANRFARSLAYPVRVHVEVDRRGRRAVYLNDGRHRMTAAREAGATHIRAQVVEYGPRGGVRRQFVGPVRIAAPRGKAGAGKAG